jgi:hypothetical protein
MMFTRALELQQRHDAGEQSTIEIARTESADPTVLAREHPDVFAAWQQGKLRPWMLTRALGHRTGAWVDHACGAREPEADLWKQGRLYPTWENLVRLSILTYVPLTFLLDCEPDRVPRQPETCGIAWQHDELTAAYPPALVDLTVTNHPHPADQRTAATLIAEHLDARAKQLLHLTSPTPGKTTGRHLAPAEPTRSHHLNRQ